MKARVLALLAVSLVPALMAGRTGGHALVLQSDFGLKDGAVAAMRGVAAGVSPALMIHDLSHENTAYDIWEAAYRLKQSAPYWPAGTVFVSVVDPGVGTERKSVVLRTKSGHFFVTPDNGTLTLVAEDLGIAALREINGEKNRRAGSARSHTFHGRDIYVHVGARLAAGVIGFDEVGPLLPSEVVRIEYARPACDNGVLSGMIPFLDFKFGNVWTNIDESCFAKLAPKFGNRFRVTIARAGRQVFTGEMPYVRTFAEVPRGAPLLYLNSLMNISFAFNADSFARKHEIGYGVEWSVRVERPGP